MNTTKVGNLFEEAVFKTFSRRLRQGVLLVNPEYSSIYRKKGYYSRDRESDIIVDISIESFLPGQKKYSYLTVIECKNYTHTVPVDDIEEFHAKLTQIAGNKGFVITRSCFAEGAINYARSKGIGLIVIRPNSRLKYVLARSATGLITQGKQQEVENIIHRGLLDNSFVHDHINFFGFIDGQFVHSLNRFFEVVYQKNSIPTEYREDFFGDDKKSFQLIAYVAEKDIEAICQDILKKNPYSGWQTPVFEIANKLEMTGALKIMWKDTLGLDAKGNVIMGKISFNPVVISLLRDSPEGLSRQKFTLAHELGHYWLEHSKYMSREYYSSIDFDHFGSDASFLEEIRKLEWQANCFASNLLVPKDILRAEFEAATAHLDVRDKGYGPLFVDDQRCNLENFYQVTDKLKTRFNVSRKVIELALKKMDLLNDQRTSFEPAGSLLGNLKVSMFGSRW